MGRYRIRVATGAWLFSGSHNRVQLWLVGARGEAELQLHLRPVRGQVSGPERGPPTLVQPGPAAGGRRGRGRWGDEGQRDRAGGDLTGRGEDPESGPGSGAWAPAPPPADLVLAASTASPGDARASVNAGSAVRPEAAQRAQTRGQLRDGPRSRTSCPALPRPPQAWRRRRPEQATGVSGGLGQRRLRKVAPDSH